MNNFKWNRQLSLHKLLLQIYFCNDEHIFGKKMFTKLLTIFHWNSLIKNVLEHIFNFIKSISHRKIHVCISGRLLMCELHDYFWHQNNFPKRKISVVNLNHLKCRQMKARIILYLCNFSFKKWKKKNSPTLFLAVCLFSSSFWINCKKNKFVRNFTF